MSELQEGLLGPSITKKRVLAIILVTILLVAGFAYSVMIYTWFFGSARLDPNENYSNTTPEDPILTEPPFPWNLSDFEDFAQDLDLTQEELEQLLDMFDGDIRDLDLRQMAGLIGALLFSDEEVFRIYDYDNIDSVSGNLWKYESFDSYENTGWECTSPLNEYPFYDQFSSEQHIGKDLYTILLPLSPDTGSYSFVIPNLFPNPYIFEDSVIAYNINEAETELKKTDFNSTTLTLEFTSSGNVNVSYQLFGLDLPSFAEIESNAVDEAFTPITISDKFIQLPTGIDTYINSHPYFQDDYNNLDAIIEESDNAAQVAYKIKSYIEANFAFGTNALETDPPADDEDIVEWFCEHREGVWSDFASAFSVFCRTFGVASRFIDGYNSRFLEEVYDSQQGKNAIPIRYRNIYNWAEIYVPTSTSGDGNWVQVDVCENISPSAVTGEFNITAQCEPINVTRGDTVNISATLSSDNFSIDGRQIEFYDISMDQTISQVITDSNGNAHTIVNIDNDQTIGPHLISASYSSAFDYTNYSVNGSLINLDLVNTIPSEVNISRDPNLRIQGNLVDPISNNKVRFADLLFTLYPKGSTTILDQWFIPNATNLNNPYNIDETVSLQTTLPAGEYEMEANFSGTWGAVLFSNPNLSDNSKISFNITKEETYQIEFYIDDYTASDITRPNITRYASIELKAILRNELGTPVSGESISFYDYSNSFIGDSMTNASGVATYNYIIDDSIAAGPNKIFARYGNTQNSSFFILDDQITLNLNNWPNNREISRSGGSDRSFDITGTILDSQFNPVQYGQVYLRMFDGTTDVSHYLNLESSIPYSDINGNLNLKYSVDGGTPTKNYTLTLEFNGYFNYPNPDPNFNIPSPNLSDTSNSDFELKVYDEEEIVILFDIEGIPTRNYYDNINPPEVFNRGDNIDFEVWINQSDDYAPEGSIVRLIDVYSETILDNYTFNSTDNGNYLFNNVPTTTFHAGLHRIKVEYEYNSIIYDTFNYTYIIINETINDFNAQLTQPSDYSIQRNVESFRIDGHLIDNSEYLRYLEIGVFLFDMSNNEVSVNLNPQYYQTTNDGTFTFYIDSIDDLQGEYYLRIDFNGSIHAPGLDITDSSIMRHSISNRIYINVTAGTNIIQQDYYTLTEDTYPDYWVSKDTLFVIGNLTWDNSTPIAGMNITVSVKLLDGTIIESKTGITDTFGGFNVSIYIDPDNDKWPLLRSESEIWVYFDPIPNRLDYAESSSKLFTN